MTFTFHGLPSDHSLQGKPTTRSSNPMERPAWWGTRLVRKPQEWSWVWVLQPQVHFEFITTLAVSFFAISWKTLSQNDPASCFQILEHHQHWTLSTDNQWPYNNEWCLMHTKRTVNISYLNYLLPESWHLHIYKAHCWCQHFVLCNRQCQWLERGQFPFLSVAPLKTKYY